MEPHNSLLHDFAARAARLEAEARSEIEGLLGHAHPVELFVGALAPMMFGTPDELTEAAYGTVPVKAERLAFELYPGFRDALALPEGGTTLRPGDAEVCRAALDRLLTGQSLGARARRAVGPEPGDSVLGQVQGRAGLVRGDAYPAQTERRVRGVQGKFDVWFEHRTGISSSRACDILQAVGAAHTDAYNGPMRADGREGAARFEAAWRAARRKPKGKRSDDEASLVKHIRYPAQAREVGGVFAFDAAASRRLPARRESLDLEVTEREWEGLHRLIGLTSDDRADMDEPVEVRRRPLYVLPDGRALLVDRSNALDALWAAFDGVARDDQAFYDKRYQAHASAWLEERVVEYLSRLFSSDALYRTLDYPDPDRPAGATAELDVAVCWGPFLVLVECKAKQFRLEGQLGDAGRLRTDILRNVEEAFGQVRRALRYIESAERPTFTERHSGRQLVVDKARLRRPYPLTVSLHELGALTTRLAALAPLGLFREAEHPFAIGESDLDIVTELLPGPDVFLHYVEKRVALHRVKPNVSGDDVDLLGAYLDTRFVDGRLWDNPQNEKYWFALDGYSSEIDRWARHRWEGVGSTPELRLAVPDEVRDVLAHLRNQPDDESRWIAFCLLDLPPDVLGALARGIRLARTDPAAPGGSRRFVAPGPDAVVCVVSSNGHPGEWLAANLSKRVAIERYHRKAARGFGLGFAVGDASPLTAAVFQDEPWHYDARMEALVAADPIARPLNGSALPGRNEPCHCGSGKKHKRCCLPKLAQARRAR